MLADDIGKRVMVVDTSNEIGGDGADARGGGCLRRPPISLEVSTTMTRLRRSIREHACHLAQLRRLAHAGTAQQQQIAPGADEVLQHVDGAEDGAAHAQGEAHHAALAVADGGDAVERALDASTVVLARGPHLGHHVLQVGRGDGLLAQALGAADEPVTWAGGPGPSPPPGLQRARAVGARPGGAPAARSPEAGSRHRPLARLGSIEVFSRKMGPLGRGCTVSGLYMLAGRRALLSHAVLSVAAQRSWK